jgi:hypothetical protein
MERLTLHQSTIHGAIQGKPVMATVRTSPPGLLLPAGQYVLRPPVDNPVYGLVMAIEPVPAASAVSRSAVTFRGDPQTPTAHKSYTPSAHKFEPPSTHKVGAPAAIKLDSPAIKFDSPAIKFDSPAIKFDTRAGGAAQPLVIASRPVAGNCLVVTAGLGELVDALQRSGGVILVVE